MNTVRSPATLASPGNVDDAKASTAISTEVSQLARYQIHDPLAFLIEPVRLTRSEAIWQRIFAAVPWMLFPCFIGFPLYVASLRKGPHVANLT